MEEYYNIKKDIQDFKRSIDYSGIYFVTMCGKVGSYDKKVRNGPGTTRLCKGRILSGFSDKDGYRNYDLYNNKKSIKYKGHRLIWEAFNGPIPEGMQINHINGIKDDNRLSNLEVCTDSENKKHRYRVLKQKHPFQGMPSHKHPRRKPVLQYSKDGDFIREWASITCAKKALNVHNINLICKGVHGHKTAGGFIWKYKEQGNNQGY